MQPEEAKNQEHPTLQKLREKFPQVILSVYEFRQDTTILIEKENLLKIMQFLHNESSLSYHHLSSISGVDYLHSSQKDRFGIIYHLLSYKNNQRIAVKVLLPEEEPCIESVYHIWKSADWQEREIYDLLGIVFQHHPNLNRIFLPEDFKGHPLRKDYPIKGTGEREKF